MGSADVITNALGGITKESDYYPYGGEIPVITGDSNRYKFSGKERDTESGLDNFGARYDSSNLGRFMTPDWAARPTSVPYAVFGDPQSLNLYGYVRNDPVSRADADGHKAEADAFVSLADNSPFSYGMFGEALDLVKVQSQTQSQQIARMQVLLAQARATGNSGPPPQAQNTAQQQGNSGHGQVAGPHWQYSQGSHTMEHIDAQGHVTDVTSKGVYSGEGAGQNNPAMQSVSNAQNPGNSGPIPQGVYSIGNAHTGTSERGSTLKNSMKLDPSKTTNTFGRSDFSIHGDSRANPGHASWGCVIMPPGPRAVIANSPDRILVVIP